MKLLLELRATALLCVILVVIQVATSQRQRQDCSQRCQCAANYQPFCGTDEVTYSNKCQLECAQNFCDRNLRVKFEGVCALPYIHDDGKNGIRRRPPPPYNQYPATVPVMRTTPRIWYQPTTIPPARYAPAPQRMQYTFPVLPSSQSVNVPSWDSRQPQQRPTWYESQGK